MPKKNKQQLKKKFDLILLGRRELVLTQANKHQILQAGKFKTTALGGSGVC